MLAIYPVTSLREETLGFKQEILVAGQKTVRLKLASFSSSKQVYLPKEA